MATPVKNAHAGDPFWFRFGDPLGQPPPMEFLRYPGDGNVASKQGTLEFWLAPALDTGRGWREVVGLTGQGGGLSLSMRCGSDSMMSLTVANGGRKKSLTAKGLPLKPNVFTHVAVTWSDHVQLFVAGKRYGTLDGGLPAEMPSDAEKLALRFGCAGDSHGSTRIAVDEVRLSSVVRYQGDTFAVPSIRSGRIRKHGCSTTLMRHSAPTAKMPRREPRSSRASRVKWAECRASVADSWPAASAPLCRSPMATC